MPSPMSKEYHHDFPSPPTSPGPLRQRSATLDSIGLSQVANGQLARRRDVNHNKTNSPLKTTFLLVSPQQSEHLTSVSSPMDDSAFLASARRPSFSWRKAIFNRVCTPQHSLDFGEEEGDSCDGKLHNTVEIRAMWKKAILETLLLIRMEKENHAVRARQEEGGATVSRKLDYQELTPCLKEITTVWEQMLSLHGDEGRDGDIGEDEKAIPMVKLLDYVKKGVPRTLRGQIWLFLMQQRQMSSTVPDSGCTSADYEDLLKQLTTHQHAILIDLGRTFPCHPYFAKALGPGQLELFNLLKAYSLLDTEVGYCQGLSFIVGMLLMHMEEISAFHVLKYIMYDLGLRKQFRPNMMALQIKLYQLTRLLHDHYKDVYEHFENHEISPTLYAAPWFLTLFASQFPLGFVARVFDMLFVQGIDALFKVALMLIGNHRALILQCDSFESVVDFLKTTLPEMVQVQMERIINQAFELDISKELQAYEVEYHVLSEEMTFSPGHDVHSARLYQHSKSQPAVSDRPSRLVERRRSSIDIEMMYRVEQQNRALKNQNIELLERLQHTQSQQRSHELSVHTHEIEQEKLKSHIRTLELERGALLQAVAILRKLIPREALQQLNLTLPPMPESSSPVMRMVLSTATQTDLETHLPSSSPQKSTSSNLTNTNSTQTGSLPNEPELIKPSKNVSVSAPPSNHVSNIPVPGPSLNLTLGQETPSASTCVAAVEPKTPSHVSVSSPGVGAPSQLLTTTASGATESYPSRSISNSASSHQPSNPLTPEERRRTVKVVVQQSPTSSCPDRPNVSR
ncbi:TBC1 domain family member 1-like [Physella acuta]|uniref:TBC1 domain family member 1-like n=1 Tax=Physella acuta TaxID=109671 RepID=UPI0027DB8628|nr:TBC1 domain family member 1-like [Physella acuta]